MLIPIKVTSLKIEKEEGDPEFADGDAGNTVGQREIRRKELLKVEDVTAIVNVKAINAMVLVVSQVTMEKFQKVVSANTTISV